MTSSSAWLENLGKASLTNQSNSNNYAEFEREDNVKAINQNNDSFVKGVEAEANAAADFYNRWHKNQSDRWKNILDITKTGGELAIFGTSYIKQQNEYNEWLKTVQTGDPTKDKDVQKENNRQQQVKDVAKQGQIVAEEIKNQGGSLNDQAEAWEIGGLSKNDFDTKSETRSLMVNVYPKWRKVLSDYEFTLSDGTKLSLNKARTKEQYDEIDAIINKLFLTKVSEMGYNRGFMKKHILMPMFEKSKLNAKEWYQTQGDARIAQIKIENG